MAVKDTTGRKAGSTNYCFKERMHFLSIMELVLPIGPDEWSEVGDRHSVKYPGREIDSIRRKYNQLHRKQHPTGDPDMPEDVRLAKQVKLKIGAKASIGDATETFTLEEGFPGEDQVLPEEEDSEADSNNNKENEADSNNNKENEADSNNNKENENPTPTPAKKRPYTRSIHTVADTGNNFLKVYQLSCFEDKQAREREREERREERRQEREDRKQERLERERERLERERERERERKQERLERREERDDMMRMFAMAFGANTNTEANIGRKRKL